MAQSRRVLDLLSICRSTTTSPRKILPVPEAALEPLPQPSLRPPHSYGFQPAGVVSETHRLSGPPQFLVGKRKPVKGRRAQGVRYEARGHEHYEALYKGKYIASPWFEFTPKAGPRRYCQPDALLLDRAVRRCTILEYKYQHTFDAFYQLFELYLPVLRAWPVTAGCAIYCVEVVKWFDPATYTNPRALLCADISRAHEGAFNVHIFKP